MLKRLGNILDAATGLCEARFNAALREAESTIKRIVVYTIAGLAGMVGATLLLAGGTIALAQVIGWAAALASVGGLLLVVGLLAAIVADRRAEPDVEEAKDGKPEAVEDEEVAARQLALREAISGKSSGEDEEQESKKNDEGLLGGLLKSPATAISAGLSLFALFGPEKLARRLFHAVTAFNVVANIASFFKDQAEPRLQPRARPRMEPRPDRHHRRHEPRKGYRLVGPLREWPDGH